MTNEERCNLCAACPVPGACCYHEGWNPITRERTATRTPCRFLDVTSGSCRVYPERHAWTGNACLTIEQMLRAGTVPPQCAYIDNPHAYAARPTRATTPAAAERSRRRYGAAFWRFYWRQRGTKPTCYWLDQNEICCHPFQDPPFSMRCPPDVVSCRGFARDAKHAVSQTQITRKPPCQLQK